MVRGYGDSKRKTGVRIAVCLAVLCVAAVIAGGCTTTAKDVYTPKEWRDMLKKAGDWVPLPYPESAFRPGSIIRVTEESVRWIDHLESCRYPAEALQMEKSVIPNVSFNKAASFGANAVVNFKGISAGPSFDRVSKSLLEVKDHGVDYLKILHLKDWLLDPDNRSSVSPVCMEELNKPDVYLVTESFRVSRGSYSLLDEKGAMIKLTVPKLGELLKFEPDVKYKVEADGKLTIDETVFFAVRRVVKFGDDFITRAPGQAEPQPADPKIERLFMRSAGEM